MASTKRRVYIRQRQQSSDSESEPEIDSNNPQVDAIKTSDSSKLVANVVRTLQQARKRPAGLSVAALARGCDDKPPPISKKSTGSSSDPFKLRSGGGLVELKRGQSRRAAGEEEEDVEARLAKTFATETNQRDEDAEMVKYIEEELAKRKGVVEPASNDANNAADTLLCDVPENLRPKIGQQREEMMSNQMLCGIPEIDLGVEAKMRNIEATEEAKQSLLTTTKLRHARGHLPLNHAPANMAVNFVQHTRWNYHQSNANKQSNAVDVGQELKAISSNPQTNPPASSHPGRYEAERDRLRAEKATDSLALQRFKTGMRDRRRR